MMGKQPGNQQKLFYYSLSLERRIAEKHVLRKIEAVIDFDFIYPEVKNRYTV